jgi:lactate permease
MFGATLVQVRWALATIFMILAIAFVMNWSGQTTTLGRFLAGAGPAYALLSPVIGWIGVVVTGSRVGQFDQRAVWSSSGSGG